MMQNGLITKRAVATIGEEIGYELGARMVKNYQVANPSDVHFYTIGRTIIDQILAQPGCVGMQFYNAYDENGVKTLVYVGLDKNGTPLSYQTVNKTGVLVEEKGIVADKVSRGGRSGNGEPEEDFWWGVD